nr:hypothetical protein [bacterium]
ENMKLKYFISTAFILGVSANAQAQKWFNCKACPAGTYSDGIHGCKTCASSAYSSWGGNCGPVTRTRTDYCTATGSTSSTANSKTVTENGNYGNNCGAGYYCPSGTNKNCTACTNKPDGSYYTTNCSWACSGSLTAKDGKCGCNYTYYYDAVDYNGKTGDSSGWVAYGSSRTVSTSAYEPTSCTSDCRGGGETITKVKVTYSDGTRTHTDISSKQSGNYKYYSYTFTCQ